MAKCTEPKIQHRLEYDTINARFRKAQKDHIPPPFPIQKEIDLRFQSSPFDASSRPEVNIYDLLDDDFTVDGLIPGLSPRQQLEILRIKERLLLIDRWEDAWETARPPKNGWYSLSSKDFSYELQRHNSLLNSRKLQKLQYQTRESLIELYHSLLHDNAPM